MFIYWFLNNPCFLSNIFQLAIERRGINNDNLGEDWRLSIEMVL